MKKLFLSMLAIGGLMLTSCQKDDSGIDFKTARFSASKIGVSKGEFSTPSGRTWGTEGEAHYDVTLAFSISPTSGQHNIAPGSILSYSVTPSSNRATAQDVLDAIGAVDLKAEAGVYEYTVTITNNKASQDFATESGLTFSGGALTVTGTIDLSSGSAEADLGALSPTRAYVSLTYNSGGDDIANWTESGSLSVGGVAVMDIADLGDGTTILSGGYALPGALTHDFVITSSGGSNSGSVETVNAFAADATADAGYFYDVVVEFDASAAGFTSSLGAFANGNPVGL